MYTGATIDRMRRLVTWLLVTLGIAALVRKLRKREDAEPSVVTSPSPAAAPATAEPMEAPSSAEEAPGESGGDPAAELRDRLARSRADIPSDEESPEQRRAAVHEQGRAALDEMQPSGEAPPGEQAPEEQ